MDSCSINSSPIKVDENIKMIDIKKLKEIIYKYMSGYIVDDMLNEIKKDAVIQ